jgi:3-dehydroquinate dehydratase/shikimate dehydrogenase
MIAIPITAATNEEALGLMRLAAGTADLVELRLDYMEEPPDLERLLSNRPLPVIVTHRPVREGGLFEGDETARVALLREAIALGAEYIDVEHDSVGLIGDTLATRVIVSYHNWGETPENLHDIAQMLIGSGGRIIKIATLVKDATDNFRLCQLPSALGVPTIAIGMGARGAASRILAGKFGGYLTFASLSQGAESAPGQLTAKDLVGLYNYRSINLKTRVFAILGNPIAHSLSPHIHNAAFRALGADAVYVPFELEDFDAFIAGCNCIDPGGFSVTMPHKESAFRCSRETDPVTEKIGVLNTLRIRDGRFEGTNTDWKAAVASIKAVLPEGESLSGRRVLILGAGGAARSLLHGFESEGCRVTIANRTYARAEALCREAGCEVVEWEKRAEVDYDVLANTTSLGMYPSVEATPFPGEALRAGRIVFDAVYNPRTTRLLAEAKDADCTVVDGLEMFVQQAVEQQRFWSDAEPPVDVMRKAAAAGLAHFAGNK